MRADLATRVVLPKNPRVYTRGSDSTSHRSNSIDVDGAPSAATKPLARRSGRRGDRVASPAFTMETVARRYARKILLVHAALLLAVLAAVAVAGRQVYRGARDEVIAQAEGRQQLLAAQTAQGIKNYYASVLTDMDLLRRANMATDAPVTTTTPTAAERALTGLLSMAGRNPRAGQVIGGVMWRQLQGRATLLFACDRGAGTAARPATAPRSIGSDDPALTPEVVMARSGQWINAQQETSVGEFERWADVAGNLVCVPLRDEGPPGGVGPGGAPRDPSRSGGGGGGIGGGRGIFRNTAGREPPPDEPPPNDRPSPPAARQPRREPTLPSTQPTRALVAVVPIAPVQHDFLQPLDDGTATGAWLVDQRWTAMAASRADLVGTDMHSLDDRGMAALTDRYVGGHLFGCEVIDRPFTVGAARFAPAMVAAEPVTIGGLHWELFVSTSLETVDGSVDRLSRRALIWGAGVAIAVAGILASTALGLIRGRVRVERLRHEVLTRELEQARQIQLAWLPQSLPTGAIDVAAVNSPASHISGDFYNWFELADGRLAVTIGDVTGHGMAAAFLMATTQLLVRNTLARVGSPGACLAEVNRQLCVQAFNGQFVTMLVAVLDPVHRKLELATAGHPPPLLVAVAGGKTRPLKIEPQLVLGVEPDAPYPTESIDLPAGAALVLYTDGVVECPAADGTAHAGQRFGGERLRHAISAAGATLGTSARAMVDHVVAAVDAFRGPGELDDDLTVVAVQLRPVAARVPQAAAPA
jgi:serine phosphatase RsbU (regulator of sigma subunit)